MNEKILNVINTFDFESVKKVMDAFGWKIGIQSQLMDPTVPVLIMKVVEMFETLEKIKTNEFHYSEFVVRKNNLSGKYSLTFQLDISSTSDDNPF